MRRYIIVLNILLFASLPINAMRKKNQRRRNNNRGRRSKITTKNRKSTKNKYKNTTTDRNVERTDILHVLRSEQMGRPINYFTLSEQELIDLTIQIDSILNADRNQNVNVLINPNEQDELERILDEAKRTAFSGKGTYNIDVRLFPEEKKHLVETYNKVLGNIRRKGAMSSSDVQELKKLKKVLATGNAPDNNNNIRPYFVRTLQLRNEAQLIRLLNKVLANIRTALEIKQNGIVDAKEKGIKGDCVICFEDNVECIKLSCDHQYCRNCLQQMFDMAIKEKSSENLSCPDLNCKKKLERTDIKKIAKNKKIFGEYDSILTQEWIAKQKNAKHCPTPNCKFVFLAEDDYPQKISCYQCKKQYCSHCLLDHNRDTSCKQAKANKKGDKLTEKWKMKNTKPCPNCKTYIEKNEGCLHMKCTQCKYHFCWRCLRNWGQNHTDYYQCNNPINNNNQNNNDGLHFYNQENFRYNYTDENGITHTIRRFINASAIVEYRYVNEDLRFFPGIFGDNLLILINNNTPFNEIINRFFRDNGNQILQVADGLYYFRNRVFEHRIGGPTPEEYFQQFGYQPQNNQQQNQNNNNHFLYDPNNW